MPSEIKEKLLELLEEYNTNKSEMIGLNLIRFYKKLFKASESLMDLHGLFNLLNKNPKTMDNRFMQLVVERLNGESRFPIAALYGYTNSPGTVITAIDGQYDLVMEKEQLFSAYIANNDVEDVINLFILIDEVNRIKSNY